MSPADAALSLLSHLGSALSMVVLSSGFDFDSFTRECLISPPSFPSSKGKR